MSSKSNYQELIAKCEAHLRSGRLDLAAEQLRKVVASSVPGAFRLPLAHLSRRAGVFTLGLKLLGPLVRGVDGGPKPNPTPAESVEYAILLQRSGAIREALEILEDIDAQLNVEARIARVHCYFGIWDYQSALPELEAYLLTPQTSYLGLVTRLNLAAAQVALARFDEALVTLEIVFHEARAMSLPKIEGNALELKAQIFIARNQRAEAMETLLAAAMKFSATNSPDLLFVEKWQAVLEAKKTGSIEPIAAVRAKAQSLGYWETVRDCDFRSLELKFDVQLLNYLYFGTPFKAYRERIREAIGQEPLESHYIWGHAGKNQLDLETGALLEGSHLQKGGKIHAVIGTLMRDFYRPISIGGLFAEVFPGEYFNIRSSPGRVTQIISRARRWIVDNKLPLSIVIDGGYHSIALDGDFAIRIAKEYRSKDIYSGYLEELSKQFGENSFAASEARKTLDLSESGFRRFIQWAIDSGYADKFGASTATIYYIKATKAA